MVIYERTPLISKMINDQINDDDLCHLYYRRSIPSSTSSEQYFEEESLLF